MSAIVLFASMPVAVNADECPVRVLTLGLEGKGTSDQIYRYRVVLEAQSTNAPRDADLQIQTNGGGKTLYARVPHLQLFQDEGAYDDVVVFDRPIQDVSGIAVVDTVSGEATTPCTSPIVRTGDQVGGLVGWDIPTVIAMFSDAGRIAQDAAQVRVLTGRSRDASFKRKAEQYYPMLAQQMNVSGEAVALVKLGLAG